MNDRPLQVEGLGKLYRIGHREGYNTLRETLSSVVGWRSGSAFSSDRRMRLDGIQSQPVNEQFIWALKDISFEVGKGEVLGIIGPNGAGKTTLLRILSRITDPTEGQVHIHGRVGSLLEVGTGFHPELTGRENIYLNGAILGMKRFEIARKFDEIVTFSGVQKFIDTPVKRYSSGMYVRLAFAVAAHLDPEILLVDEVLAVGDAAFQEKCLGKINEVVTGGRTVLFVSHNMAAVRGLCSRALYLNGGRIEVEGVTDEVIGKYLTGVANTEVCLSTELPRRADRYGSRRIRAVKFEARGPGIEDSRVQTGSDVEFTVTYESEEERSLVNLLVAIGISDAQGNNVFLCSTGMYQSDFHNVPSRGKAICKVKNLPLIPGEYWINLMLKDDQGLADSVEKAALLNVVDGGMSKILQIPSRRWGPVVVSQEWDWCPIDVPH